MFRPEMPADSLKVTFGPPGIQVDVAEGASILEAGRQAGLILVASCGGNGICGRCRVTLVGDAVSEPEDAERRFLGQDEIDAGQRLACRAILLGDCSVHVPRTTLGNQRRLVLDGDDHRISVDAPVKRHAIEMLAPSSRRSDSDFDHLSRLLNSELGEGTRWRATEETRANVSRMAEDSEGRFTAITRDDEVIGVMEAGRRILGVAIDLGCTKIAAYLLDLESGEELGVCGIPNPQITYGEDVITRLDFASRSPLNARELSHCVQAGLSTMISDLTDRAGVDGNQIGDVCLVGNTAMMHLFEELPIDGLLAAPFSATRTTATDVRCADIGIDLPGDVHVHILPGIGSFVGADHVAMILANGLHSCSHTALGIDIGTNTEIVLHKPDDGLLLTASCPAGPAFEGGHIGQGMGASPGAIEGVRSTPNGPVLKTIGDQLPVGLCGSGIVDVVACLRRSGAIDRRGHLQAAFPGVRQGDSGREYLLVEAGGTGHGRDIVVSQQDISEIQLAKAAVSASIKTLLIASNTDEDEILELVLAGAFGSHLDLQSSFDIGLLPPLENATYLQAGNSAGAGAKMALVSREARRQAVEIARRATRIDLTGQKGFNRLLALETKFNLMSGQDPGLEAGSGC
ncbi:MAG: DUF4445 domain-containing protein [Actinomycetia bacterium]|nr:DUF4445 domain-containing protein [Actinomycetes bacterium]